MINQLCHVKTVIDFRIAQLIAHIDAGFSAPGKFNRRQTPRIVNLRSGMRDCVWPFRADVARTARYALRANPAFTCDDVHAVQTVSAIAEVVPRRPPAFTHVTIRAARMRGHGIDAFPCGSSAILRLSTRWQGQRYEDCKGSYTKSTV